MAPTPNRRSARRLAPRGARVTCRRGTLDLGPNLAVVLLDVSAAGALLEVREPLAAGEAVYVTLEAAGNGRRFGGPAVVAHCAPGGDAHYTGVRFRKPLAYAELAHLTWL